MISYDLTGKTALITGAASGIGLATATMLCRAGATVAINFLAEDTRGAQSVAKLKAEGFRAIEAPGNVGRAPEAEKMVQQALDKLGRLDMLANNAGTPGVTQSVPSERLDLLTDEVWAAVLDTNLLGTFRCTKAAAPALKAARGAVINTASIAGLNSRGSSMAYGASKAGVISLTKNLARALAPEVRVNAVAPGSVASTWQIAWSDEELKNSTDHALLKRRCTPEDIAEVIVFLGFGAAMVTAQTIVVDGGLTTR